MSICIHNVDLNSASCGECDAIAKRRLVESEGHCSNPDCGKSPRIYTRCPACGNDTLTINDDKHLLCTWIDCPDPTLIDRLPPKAVGRSVSDHLINASIQLNGIAGRCAAGTPSMAHVEAARAAITNVRYSLSETAAQEAPPKKCGCRVAPVQLHQRQFYLWVQPRH